MSALLRKRIPAHSKIRKVPHDVKKHLKHDFHGRCAYCDDLDSLVDVNFEVEHFAPKSKFPERQAVYQNLLYACPYCNRAKSKYWVSDDPDVNINGNEGIVNPCSEDYDLHLGRSETGCIYPKTLLGEFMYRKLKLYFRRHELFFNLERLKGKIEELRSAGVGGDVLPLYERLNEYYQLAPIVKRQKGEILRCPIKKRSSNKKG